LCEDYIEKLSKYILSLQAMTKVMKSPLVSINSNGVTFAPHLLVMVLVLLAHSVFAQNQLSDQNIKKALQDGSAPDLAVYFNASIDLTLLNYEGTYSKKQAEQILKKFFENHPVKSFTIEHSGTSNDGSRYLIGSHQTTTQKTFRVYILIKNRNDSDLIQQIQFEDE
jgi:hypothetical protein